MLAAEVTIRNQLRGQALVWQWQPLEVSQPTPKPLCSEKWYSFFFFNHHVYKEKEEIREIK
jgi:hypothetical protein